MSQKPTFNRKKTTTRSLSTPVIFYQATKTSPEPNSKKLVEVYKTFAEVYNPSIKDIEIMNAQGVQNAVTINIRNTQGYFFPTLDHIVTLNHPFYKNTEFNIIDIAPSNDFIKMILTGVDNG